MKIDKIVTDDDLIEFLLDQHEQTKNPVFLAAVNSIWLYRHDCGMFKYSLSELNEWISVEDRLPETNGWYLVYTAPDKKHRSVNKAEFCKGFEWNNFEPYWRGAGGNWGNVTHWMPLPEPPKKE